MPKFISDMRSFLGGLDYSMKLTGLAFVVTAGVLAIANFNGFGMHRSDASHRPSIRDAGATAGRPSVTDMPVALTEMTAEGAAAMAKEDGVRNVLRDGRAVDGHKGPFISIA